MSLYMYPDRFIYFFFLGDIYIYITIYNTPGTKKI